MTSFDQNSFKFRDAASYDPVVGDYERFTERFTTPLARHIVELAALTVADRVLDVGAGTGVVTLEAARCLGSAGRVVGLDLSSGMLAHARERAAAANLSGQVSFVVGDAERLEFADQSFDVVVSLFAIMHFPNPKAAVAEMFRVLRPGGRLVMGLGAGPALLSMCGVCEAMNRVLAKISEISGRRLTAPDFLNALVRKHLPGSDEPEESNLARSGSDAPSAVTGLVADAGFTGIKSGWKGGEARLESAEEFWDLQTTFSSLARKRLAAAAPETVAAIHEEFLQASRKVQRSNGKLVYRYGARIIHARRP